MKYIDEMPFMAEKTKDSIYRTLLADFSQSGKPFAMIDEEEMPKTKGRHYDRKTNEFINGQYYDDEYTALRLSAIAKKN